MGFSVKKHPAPLPGRSARLAMPAMLLAFAEHPCRRRCSSPLQDSALGKNTAYGVCPPLLPIQPSLGVAAWSSSFSWDSRAGTFRNNTVSSTFLFCFFTF